MILAYGLVSVVVVVSQALWNWPFICPLYRESQEVQHRLIARCHGSNARMRVKYKSVGCSFFKLP
jgi:hypothetical protein